jgi:hypothetical protein
MIDFLDITNSPNSYLKRCFEDWTQSLFSDQRQGLDP